LRPPPSPTGWTTPSQWWGAPGRAGTLLELDDGDMQGKYVPESLEMLTLERQTHGLLSFEG